MGCPATVNVILPEHPVTGLVTTVVHCMSEEQCADRHFGWVQDWLPATSVEWPDEANGFTYVITGSQPGPGTIDFFSEKVDT